MVASEVDKRKSEPKTEESIAERTKLRRERIAEIKREEKNINNLGFQYYFSKYLSDMYKKLCETEGTENETQVNLIKEILNEVKKYNKSAEAKKNVIEGNKKIISIVEHIFYFNQLDQSGKGLKILTPNQMRSRLPITLAQLNAGNNSEKLKNEIRQLLYSLYWSKKLTKQLYKFDWHYLKMQTIFMNTENSKTGETHRFKLDLTGKLNLKTQRKT